jgi:hypothetical protein
MSTPVLDRPREDTFTDDEVGELAPCESTHMVVKVCNGSVAYRLSWCIGAINVCANTIEHPTHGIAARRSVGRNCADCGQPTAGCWKFWPV